jgi:hypothetical protein
MAHTRSLDPPHCFSNTIDAFSGCLYPQPCYIFPPPCGKLSDNEIGKTIRITLEREMRRINAPFNNRRLTRFDIVMHTLLRPSGLWVAFNPPDSSHDQPITGRGAGCYKPAASGSACASAR